MPRCARCGRVNPDGAAFCQDCGDRLDPSSTGSGPVSNPAPRDASTFTCPHCGAANPETFKFCQQCGQPLRLGPPAPAVPTVVTPPSGLPVSLRTPVAGGAAPSPPPPSPPLPSVFSGPGVGASAAQGAQSPVVHVAPSSAGCVEDTPPRPVQSASSAHLSGAGSASEPGPVPGSAVRARLVGVRRDGTDGETYPIYADTFDLGRTAGDLLFADDVYLSERHLRIEHRAEGFVAVVLSTRNGVFVRIRRREPLWPQAHILLGMQLLRFEPVPEGERAPAPAMEHGVRVFGTPVREPWGRLRQMTTAGTTRDVYHLVRREVVLGREGGDIVFSDDDFMSRMHASVRSEAGGAWIVDLNSSNGTYLQIDGARPLEDGDYLRLGDQLLRFELP